MNDETKFELVRFFILQFLIEHELNMTVFLKFTKISDHLYQTFDRAVSVQSFPVLSNTMLNWVEQACTSQNLKQLVSLSLMQMQQNLDLNNTTE